MERLSGMYKCTMHIVFLFSQNGNTTFWKEKEFMYYVSRTLHRCVGMGIALIVYIQFNGKVDLNHVHDLPCIIWLLFRIIFPFSSITRSLGKCLKSMEQQRFVLLPIKTVIRLLKAKILSRVSSVVLCTNFYEQYEVIRRMTWHMAWQESWEFLFICLFQCRNWTYHCNISKLGRA